MAAWPFPLTFSTKTQYENSDYRFQSEVSLIPDPSRLGGNNGLSDFKKTLRNFMGLNEILWDFYRLHATSGDFIELHKTSRDFND
jgi:hypothetical protein